MTYATDIFTRANRMAVKNQQFIGEKHDLYVTLEQLMNILKALEDAPETANLHGARVKCEFCNSEASFIIKRCAVCFAHRSVPIEHAESMLNR